MTPRIAVSQVTLLTLMLFVMATAEAQDTKAKDPVSTYGLTMKYRKPGQDEFDKTQKHPVECFVEQETGNAIYISLPGAISVLPKGHFKGGDGSKPPLSQHGFELKVRPADTQAKTPLFAVECYHDDNNGNLVYLTEKGGVSVVASKFAALNKAKTLGYSLTHGMSLRVRKAGDPDWEKPTTKKYGIDVFEDLNNGNVLYLSETGSVVALPAALAGKSTEGAKTPEWQYGLELPARALGEKQVTKDTKRYNLEVFKDVNNGCMVYIVENGNLAVVGSKVAKFGERGKAKDPYLARGFDLGVRGLDEPKFTDKTKKHPIEVYTDENNGNIIYITDAGQIAVVAPKEE